MLLIKIIYFQVEVECESEMIFKWKFPYLIQVKNNCYMTPVGPRMYEIVANVYE